MAITVKPNEATKAAEIREVSKRNGEEMYATHKQKTYYSCCGTFTLDDGYDRTGHCLCRVVWEIGQASSLLRLAIRIGKEVLK